MGGPFPPGYCSVGGDYECHPQVPIRADAGGHHTGQCTGRCTEHYMGIIYVASYMRIRPHQAPSSWLGIHLHRTPSRYGPIYHGLHCVLASADLLRLLVQPWQLACRACTHECHLNTHMPPTHTCKPRHFAATYTYMQTTSLRSLAACPCRIGPCVMP